MSVTSNSVVEAIVARFNSSPVAALATGSGNVLYFDQLPEEKNVEKGAFVALTDVSDTGPRFTTELSYQEDTAFSFEVYAVGLANAVAVLLGIKAAFDRPGNEASILFLVFNASVYGCHRQQTTYEAVGERSATGETVYKAKVRYLISTNYELPSQT